MILYSLEVVAINEATANKTTARLSTNDTRESTFARLKSDGVSQRRRYCCARILSNMNNTG